MKRNSIILVSVLLMALLLSACSNKLDISEIEGEVGSINGIEMKARDLALNYKIIEASYKTLYGKDALAMEDDKGKTIESYLDEEILPIFSKKLLIEGEASKMDLKIDEEDEFIFKDNFIKELGGDEKFREFLKYAGLEEKDMDDYFKKSALEEKYKEEVMKDLAVDEDLIKNYYEENKDEMINYRISYLVYNDKKKAEKDLKKLEEVAMEDLEKDSDVFFYSSGGDEYFSKGELSQKLEEEILGLDIGEISGLIENDGLIYIFRLEDIKDEYKDLKASIEEMLQVDLYFNSLDKMYEEADLKLDDNKIEETIEMVK